VALPPEGKPTDVEDVRALVNTTVGAAIAAMGGTVEVRRVAGGVVSLGFKGPPALGKGIAAAVRDKFSDVTDVKLEAL
jgi:Fe-S cluster biogenesis protein NfuA